MRLIFGLLGVVGATTPCDKVPAGEYYAGLAPGKYLYLEVAEDSASFRTSLGDFAETDSDMDSDDEDRWVKGAKYLVSKIDFEMKPNCVAEIAQESRTAYWNLVRSVSAMVRICIHPGGHADMKFDPSTDELRLGCLGMRRAKEGEIKFSYASVKPKLDKVFVPRGVFVNYSQGKMYAIRVVDRATVWMKVVSDGQPKRVSAAYQILDGKMCLGSNKVTDLHVFESVVEDLKGVSGDKEMCLAYVPEQRALTLGGMEFKFEGVVPRKPIAMRR